LVVQGEAVCTCLSCPNMLDPVCGSDGKNYDNVCKLRQNACKTNTLITLISRDACLQDGKPTCVCVEPCPKILKPVYGSDGKNYDNECLLKLAACKSKSRILIAGSGRYHDKPTCVCVEPCPEILKPVYGSDGKDYDNECLLKLAACKSKSRILIAGFGHDKPTCVCVEPCPEILKPVYGSDGKDYDNECLLKLAACKSKSRILIAGFGLQDDKPTCVCVEPCPEILKPVYGSDGKDYDNECLLKLAACKSKSRILIAGFGQPCPEILKPVYGSDGKDYDNECLLKLAAC
ncbi:predicted protein, partial [Nematostella vectensis]